MRAEVTCWRGASGDDMEASGEDPEVAQVVKFNGCTAKRLQTLRGQGGEVRTGGLVGDLVPDCDRGGSAVTNGPKGYPSQSADGGWPVGCDRGRAAGPNWIRQVI